MKASTTMEITIQDMKFSRYNAANGEVRVYVEWLHTVGVKTPRFEKIGHIVAKPAVSYVNNHGDIKGMMETRGITLKAVGKALAGK
jgi:hypothetical protein